jgi:hypothetical protein
MSLPPLNPGKSESGGLGSLAQSARSKKLKEVRSILIAVGVLTIVANLIGYFLGRAELEKVGRMDLMPSFSVMAFSAVGLGVLFVIFGLIIHQYPVAVTVLSLVLYVGAIAVFAILIPQTLATGWIFKAIIIIALIKGIGTAVAYQKEMNAAREEQESVEQESYE